MSISLGWIDFFRIVNLLNTRSYRTHSLGAASVPHLSLIHIQTIQCGCIKVE